jgi:hypothetical protein
MIENAVIYCHAHSARQIVGKTVSTDPNTEKASLNIRTKDVGKVDTLKVAKRSRDTQKMSDDRLTKNSLRKSKRKERQSAKKQIKLGLKD